MARVPRTVVLVAACSALAGCGGAGLNKAGGKPAAKPVTLTLANFLGDSGELDTFVGAVRRLSHGSLRIVVRSGWRLGQVRFEDGLIGDVRAGRADLGVAGTRVWDDLGVDSFRALGAPLLIDSYPLEERVLTSPLAANMLGGLRPLGLVGIGVLPGPLRKPLAATRALVEPDAFRGLRLGIQDSRIAAMTMRALGATPVAFGSQAPIAGLDGAEMQVSAVQGNRYDKVGRYLATNVNLWPRPLVIFTSRRAAARLTSAQRRVLMRAAAASAGPEVRRLVRDERADTAILCTRGMHFATADAGQLQLLGQAVQPVYAALERDPAVRGQIAQIARMERGGAPDGLPACRPGATAAPAAATAAKPSPLDGVYTYTDTPAGLRARGAPQGDVIPENWGHMVLVLDRGRFAATQENQLACTWGYGTFTVAGERLTQRFIDGGGQAPENAENKPGETFTFRWSLYRDKLRLAPIQPKDLARFLWHRVSTVASRSSLSTRCPPPAAALPR